MGYMMTKKSTAANGPSIWNPLPRIELKGLCWQIRSSSSAFGIKGTKSKKVINAIIVFPSSVNLGL